MTQARNGLAVQYRYLVPLIAGDYAEKIPSWIEIDDLERQAELGLIQAAERYDPLQGVDFPTFARNRMKGAIGDWLRQMDWATRKQRAKQKRVHTAQESFYDEHSQMPTHSELAERLNMSVEQLTDYMQKGAMGVTIEPYDALIHEAVSAYESPEDAAARNDIAQLVQEAIERLSTEEAMIVQLWMSTDQNIRAAAAKAGIPTLSFSTKLRQALELLRNDPDLQECRGIEPKAALQAAA